MDSKDGGREVSNSNGTSSDIVIDMDVDEEVEFIPESQPIFDDEEETARAEDIDDMEEDENFLAGVEELERETLLKGEKEEEDELRRKKEVEALTRLSPSQRIFPDLRPSNFHTVAFKIKPNYTVGDDLEPHPKNFQSRWEAQYVPMPCAEENTRVFKIRDRREEDEEMTGNDEAARPPVFVEKTVWMWERIEGALMQPMLSTQDITSAIKRYHRAVSQLPVLDYTINVMMSEAERTQFFAEVLPCMQTLALDIARFVTCPLPVLSRFQNYSISLSQKQIACLLASAFFSTFPRRFEKEMEYPTINLIELFQCQEDDSQNSRLIKKSQKLRCILNYFVRVAKEMPRGAVTFTRRSIKPAKSPQWGESTKKINKIIPLLNGTIEDDGAGMLQVDFANKFIGGGVLGNGAVQEEILFVTYPELMISRLFTEKLHPCEALIVTGCERFSRYAGYASSFMYDGDFIDTTQFDSKGRRCTQFVGIDALYITKPVTQFHPRYMSRELNKAYTGFSSPSSTCVPVATGKWGCGAFNGNSQLKTILQLMAASEAGRDVVFFTFGDKKLQLEIDEMFRIIKHMIIKDVWTLLTQYNKLFCATTSPKLSLYEFLLKYGPDPPSLPSVESESPSTSSATKRFREVPITKFYSKEKDSSELPAPPAKKSLDKDIWLDDLALVKKQMASTLKKEDAGSKSSEHTKLTESDISALLEAESQSQDEFIAAASARILEEGSLQNEEVEADATLTNDGPSLNNTDSFAKTPLLPPGQKTLTDFYNYEKRS